MAFPAMADDLDAAARRDIYALASRIFAQEVDLPLYEQLCAGRPDAYNLVLIEPELVEEGPDAALEALAVEYCQLFVAPRSPCSPYASIQRGERILGGRARDALESFMTSHGIEIEERARIASPDHAAVMLGVLAHLADDADTDAAYAEFLRDQVLPWIPRFLANVRRQAGRALYRTAAALTSELLDEERRRLGI